VAELQTCDENDGSYGVTQLVQDGDVVAHIGVDRGRRG
jgi:hypothetical protein